MATSKKSTSKKTARKKSPAPGGSTHIQQIDAGWYAMYQNDKQTGQVVVSGVGGNTTEYYFLYQSGTGAGEGPYTYPGPKTGSVTTTYTYKDVLPPGWTTPAKYQSNLYPIVAQLVTAVCTVSLAKKKAAAAPKKKSAAPRKKK